MKRSILFAVALGLVMPASYLAAAENPAPAVAPVKTKIAATAVIVTATVAAVDQETREVTLKDSEGKQHSFIADEKVRNLAQVEVGDIVVIKYFERMALNVYPVKAGAKGQIAQTEVSRSDPGQKPHGTVTQKIQLTGQVAAIDPETRIVTIEGKHGDVLLPVSDAVDLSSIKLGSMVRADYVETMSITVNSPETMGK
jgi:hypothetical protein